MSAPHSGAPGTFASSGTSGTAGRIQPIQYLRALAVLAVVRRETNSWKWPAFSFVYSTTLAWIMSFVVYQGGRLIGMQ